MYRADKNFPPSLCSPHLSQMSPQLSLCKHLVWWPVIRHNVGCHRASAHGIPHVNMCFCYRSSRTTGGHPYRLTFISLRLLNLAEVVSLLQKCKLPVLLVYFKYACCVSSAHTVETVYCETFLAGLPVPHADIDPPLKLPGCLAGSESVVVSHLQPPCQADRENTEKLFDLVSVGALVGACTKTITSLLEP